MQTWLGSTVDRYDVRLLLDSLRQFDEDYGSAERESYEAKRQRLLAALDEEAREEELEAEHLRFCDLLLEQERLAQEAAAAEAAAEAETASPGQSPDGACWISMHSHARLAFRTQLPCMVTRPAPDIVLPSSLLPPAMGDPPINKN